MSGTTINLADKTFGKLIVLSRAGSRRKSDGSTSALWLCRCECGTTKVIDGRKLRLGRIKSCGCNHYSTQQKIFQHGDITTRFWRNFLGSAKKRNIKVTITIEDAWNVFIKQQRLCALSGTLLTFSHDLRNRTDLQTASIDRIDSHKDYEYNNIQWVHKDINMMKQSLTQDEFIKWCRKIAEHNLT